MSRPSKSIQLLLAVALLLHAQAAFAVAYCALRDPVNTIYSLFPEADSYRSSVQTVGREAREAVAKRLPLALHFNELGRHTLYVALQKGQPVGFVHARSEAGGWGLTEFAWAIELDLSIRTVQIQRSRDPSLRRLKPAELKGMVGGRSLDSLVEEHASRASKSNSPKRLLLASAMKTLVITETVWPDEFVAEVPLGVFSKTLPDVASVDPIKPLYDESTVGLLTANGLADSPAFQRDQLAGYRLKNSSGEPMGLAVLAPFDLESPARSLWWLVNLYGEILEVIDGELRAPSGAFRDAVGIAPSGIMNCSSLVELAALEISLVSRSHFGGLSVDGLSVDSLGGDRASNAR